MTEEQQRALATLTIAYPAGISLTEDRVDEIQVCDGLVESGHAVQIAGDEIDGKGYQLSPAMVEAHRRVAQERADEAGQN